MAVKSPEHYLKRAKAMKPRVFMDGKAVEDITEHPVTRTVVEANLASYEWAMDPEGAKVLTRPSHLTGEPCNIYNTLNRSTDDLLQRAAAGLYAAEHLGTCIYRCVGCDAFNALAATTYEIDRDLGTSYHGRLMDFLRYVQDEDLTVAGAMTEPRGPRNQKLGEWADPDLSLHIVDRNDKGIVVRGAKINISGAYACDWTIVMPQGARRPGEEDYALSFAIPNGEKGVTYVCQFTPYSAERLVAEKPEELGNPRFGQRETSMIVFEDVFVPWERVFLAGETKYAGRIVTRFAQMHRMVCGGSCKVGFGKILIGAARLIQEFKGLEKVPHINDQLTEMITLLETVRACSKAAAIEGKEQVPGSGVYFPDDLLGNVSKLNICNAFWRMMALAGDIGGGLLVTMPSLKELENPETRKYMEKYYGFGADIPAEKILRVTKLLQNWTAGLHGVGTWHGAGPVQAQKIMVQRLADFQEMKRLALQMAGIDEGDRPGKEASA
ncbi:MAG: aromatic ring hydroxylase [Candidatus Dadabacteria bacterium]|nr:MAG: aromatic ring hydroxylase [Candidatus Dadabacteria bacterium]